MHITTSNVLTESDITVTIGANVESDKAFMLNSDFSEQYVSNTTDQFLAIEINVANLGYFAIAGVNLYDNADNYSLEYWTGSAWATEAAYIPDWNATTLFIIKNPATKYRLYITKTLSNAPIIVPYIAGGAAWEVPNRGEEAGYARIWSSPQLAQRTQTNYGMPTSQVIETVKIAGALQLSNLSTDDVNTTWSYLQEFALKEGCFIVEDEFYGDRAYYCYNVKPEPVKAHSQTRSLQVASMKFDAWTGRT